MSSDEIAILIVSFILFVVFIFRWYNALFSAWPKARNRLEKRILKILPLCIFALFFITLKYYASFDVVNSVIYIIFYIVLGFAWMCGGFYFMSACFGIMWTDDVIFLGNKAALPLIIGEAFALALIYAGANIGDGPGWWCVIFAGALGFAAWTLLSLIFHFCTGIFERITVDRNLGSGIRFCLYLIIIGFILGRACSGDWTSFVKTIEEFAIGWPALVVTALFIIIELLCKNKPQEKGSV